MDVSKTIIEELTRYNKINKYIMEQDAPDLPPAPGEELPPPPAPDAGVAGATPPPPPAADAEPTPVDVENDPDVEKIDDKGESTEGEGDTEELDITDLVTSQKNMEEKQSEYFENLFKQLSSLEGKLSEMDNIMDKINSIEQKIEKYREKTPQEKLELRSLDSGPFNQKLTDFFDDKMEDIEKSGKNEYVITSDDVESYSPSEIKNSFNDYLSSDDDTKSYGYR
jgi:molecular chaperone GrpE (heat shock protein)